MFAPKGLAQTTAQVEAVLNGADDLAWQGGGAVDDLVKLAGGVGGSSLRTGIHWNPLNGPGPLGERVAATFRGASYTEAVTLETTTLYRVYGGKAGELGPYWTRTPSRGPLQSQIDSALLPEWGNTALSTTRIEVPSGTIIFEGFAAPQGRLVGGGNQVVIQHVDPSWILK